MSLKAMKTRKWMAGWTVFVAMLVAVVAFGEEPNACYLAYWESGLTEQQMSFEEFSQLYSDSFCSAHGYGEGTKAEGSVWASKHPILQEQLTSGCRESLPVPLTTERSTANDDNDCESIHKRIAGA